MDYISKLKEQKPTPKSIFRYSPHAINENLNNIIPFSYWEQNILSKSDYFIARSEKLTHNLIDDQILVSLFCGFSGNGKTTFLKWYFEKNKDKFSTSFLNVANAPRLATDLNKEEEEEEEETNDRITKSIIINLKKVIASDFVQFAEVLTIIKNNRFLLQDYFIIDLSQFEIEYDRNSLSSIVSKLQFNDALLIYILHNIYDFKFENKGRKKIICFDNLDDLSLIYLSEKFIHQFTKVVTSVSSITQNIANFYIYFLGAFRFIFVLREGTFAELSTHLRDFIEQGYFNKIDFKLQVSDKKIISKRLDLINLICTEEAKNAKKPILDIIRSLNDDDNYSRKVFLPLFNFDTRKLITYLLKLYDDTTANRSLRLENYFDIMKKSKFGGRGIIYRGMFNILWSNDYLASFAEPGIGYNSTKGFCNPSRVILTAILNQCIFKASYAKGRERLYVKKTNLFKILRSLKGIYTDEIIIDTISKFFYGHRTSWSHLLTVYNKNCEFDKDFLIEKEAIQKVREQENKNIFYGSDFKNQAQLLEKVGVQINPSGFICLRHLITHFEYYSKLVNYSIPLFNATKIEFIEKKAIFEFEILLTEVYNRVEKHISLMQNYFETTVSKFEKYSSENYNSSELVIKHYNIKDRPQEEEPRPNGYFHSTRVLNRHIDYIDSFRFYLLNELDEFQKTLDNMSSLDPVKNKVYVNKFIVDIIEKYVTLFQNSFDKDGKDKFPSIYKPNIQRIKDKKYTDYSIRISNKIS